MEQQGKFDRSIVVPDGGDPAFPEVINGDPSEQDAGLGREVANGAKWSMMGNLITRAGSLVVGIIVVAIGFVGLGVGIFAIALTVGQMLLTLIDLGLGTDLVRGTDEEMERKAPTLATLGMASATVGAVFLLLCAGPIARLMGSPAATPLLRVYAIMVFIGGLAIVPQAILMRRLDQKSLFFAGVSNFVVNNSLTLVLLLATDVGVLSLPIGAALGMVCEVTLFYVFTKRPIRLGWNRAILRDTLSFSAPVAGSNVLQVLLGNVDRLIVAPVLGERRLGHYTMASNVSQWPVSVFGLVVRQLAMPAFARTKPAPRDPVLSLGAQLTWLITLPVGIMLAVLSHDVIFFLYTPDFAPAVPLLTTLGIYGAIRVMFDTFTGYLYAREDSRGVLRANVAWLVALCIITWVCVHRWGSEGAAWAQVITIVVVALPFFLWSVHRAGASIRDIGRAMLPGTLAVIPAGLVCWFLSHMSDSHQRTGNVRIDAFIGLLIGATSFLAIYVPLMFHRIKASIAEMRQEGAEDQVDDDAAADDEASAPRHAATDPAIGHDA